MISILLCTYACLVPIIEFLVSCLYLYDLHFFPFFIFFFFSYGQYISTAVIDLYVNESCLVWSSFAYDLQSSS